MSISPRDTCRDLRTVTIAALYVLETVLYAVKSDQTRGGDQHNCLSEVSQILHIEEITLNPFSATITVWPIPTLNTACSSWHIKI